MIELLKIAVRLASTPLPRPHHRRDRHRQGSLRPADSRGAARRSAARSCRSTARRCRASSSRASSSATAAARSPARTRRSPGVIRAAERGTLFLDEIGDLDLVGAAEAPALSRERRDPSGRRGAPHQRRRPHRRRDQRQPRRARRAGPSSGAICSTASACADLAHPAAARTQGRNPGARRALPAPLRARVPPRGRPARRRLHRRAAAATTGPATSVSSPTRFAASSRWPPTATSLGPAHLAPEIARHWNERPTAPAVAATPGVEIRLDQPLTRALDELERRFIEHAMAASGGRVADAAQLLGLSRKGLFLKRRRCGLVGGRPE